MHLPPAVLEEVSVLLFAFFSSFSIAPRPGPPTRRAATAALRGGGGWWACGAGAGRCWSGPAAEGTARETEREVPGWKDREPSVGSGAGASGIPPPPPPSERIEELAARATHVSSGDKLVGKAGGKTSTAGEPLSSILGHRSRHSRRSRVYCAFGNARHEECTEMGEHQCAENAMIPP